MSTEIERLTELLKEVRTARNELIKKYGDLITFGDIEDPKYKSVNLQREDLNTKEKQLVERIVNIVRASNLSTDVMDCLEILSSLESYSIGKHIYGLHSTFDSSTIVESILAKGLLDTRGEGGGIQRTVHVLGNENIENKLIGIIDEFYNRAVYTGGGGAIVAFPSTLISSPTERMWIGEFPNDLQHSDKSDTRVRSLPIDRFVNAIQCVPSEFIVGVVSRAEDGGVTFTKNPRFISQLSIEEQIAVYNKFVSQGLQAVLPEKADSYRK